MSQTGRDGAPHGAAAHSVDLFISHPWFKLGLGAIVFLAGLVWTDRLDDIHEEQAEQTGAIRSLTTELADLKNDFLLSKNATSTEIVGLRGRVDLLETRISTYERDASERRREWDAIRAKYQREIAEWREREAARSRRRR